jgi:hypothetical protein
MDQEHRAHEARAAEYCLGENGSVELTAHGVGDALVALFFKLTRDLSESALQALVAAAIKEADGNANALADLIVLAFQTRATRGQGKGEKDACYALLRRLDEAAVLATLKFLPLFGYWKDLLLLIERGASKAVADASVSIFCEQLVSDDAELKAATAEGRTPSLSLAAKWAPREGGSLDRKLGLGRQMAIQMHGDANVEASRRKYRQLLSRCNAALRTTEVLMAANRWAEIEFANVASLCLHRHRKAFLNEKLACPVSRQDEATGNRHPHDEGRVAARLALQKKMVEGKLKGKQLQPHEIVSKLMGRGLSTAEIELMEAQWVAMRKGVQEALAKAATAREQAVAEAIGASTGLGNDGGALGDVRAMKAALPSKPIDLGKLVPLVDVSGSMAGQPMQAAIGLGLLTSELTAPPFRHRVLTFESSPSWVDMTECASLKERVQQVQHAGWGGSTNFEAACERILEAAEKHKLLPDQVPDLIVFSDMQFDQANRPPWAESHERYSQPPATWKTHLHRLQDRFAEVGRAVCGEPYAAPRIIFWNLRGNTRGFPAEADEPNTQMLSGFSPALLKLVLTGADLIGDEVEVEQVQLDGTKVKKLVREGPTPAQTVRAALDDEAFDPVRLALGKLRTGALAGYVFEKDGFEMVDDGL